ncbi:HPr kinase/phosphorylase [Marimonas lutisalis]|uniref:HPr kinase/phosphorylase n=1 Tax=Marimonas lutisalis TaxID=2545756 RepID=UPI0010F4DAD8|nr:HPr kinase/phosphatase C-terminal domain-containing protein [Marimonas lutisalis]
MPAPGSDVSDILHASCVAHHGRGVLILGAAGRGKSALALDLMSRGAELVADDRVIVTRRGETLVASCPPAISGRIEARFVGILAARPAPPVPLALVVDLDREEPERLPPRRATNLLGLPLPLVHNAGMPHLPAAILQYLLAGRTD